mmetsp:Transcript_69274/g.137363  ORF Transcript_69274/g.137363 Transcript_69274/m.137363 type:complete len:230 (-) Transcript_69274:212-901(-)|eukprot:CAMPEP_0174701070 /NCGR_PEP_ID=MMETSP1094-20130205/5827_1 /TAXON_ID=156173 /ORGANISM="Chrysochromulina brevifilum, Strain UTEX LB 985" /LENGTH=229 /DNA_ID=CAMNT_0015898659 /DNA_START=121 /DNA_END=810 /DNA_ORIENTATION=-
MAWWPGAPTWAGAAMPGERLMQETPAAGQVRSLVHAAGVNSGQFIAWNQFGRVGEVHGMSLAGGNKLAIEKQRARDRYKLTCVDASVAALVSAAGSKAPTHMRSEVDRVVFNRDHDRSEDAATILQELQERVAAAAARRPVSAITWAEAPLGQLNVGPPLGGSRPSSVQSCPTSSGQRAHMMYVQRETPEFMLSLRRLHERQMSTRMAGRALLPHAKGMIPGPREDVLG